MTIQEIYDWAKEHDCLDVELAKHYNMHFYEISSITRVQEGIPDSFGQQYDFLVLD